MSGSAHELSLLGRSNTNLPHVVGEFGSLVEGLEYAARGETGFNFYSPRGQLEHVLSFHDLRDRAVATGRKLLKAGLKRGDRVCVVAETGPDFLYVFFGCQYAGLIPCPMPYSMYIGGRDAYVERIAGMMTSARAGAVVASVDLIGQVSAAAEMAGVDVVLCHEDLQAIPDSGVDLVPFGPNDLAYIQYSSGSTSHPKGVLITQKAITANCHGILSGGLETNTADRAASWLPLYHDMGLVGFCLAPMLGQHTVDYLATTAFARRPVLWLKIISDNQCTITFSPTFGYDLAARRVNGSAGDYDLSSLKAAGIGGDMVRPDVLEFFAEKMAPAGFDPTAFVPSYGMAESTLAVTFVPLKDRVKVDCVDRAYYKLSRRAVPAGKEIEHKPERQRTFVACGKPMPGHEIEVRDDNGNRLEERDIGHIVIKGPSVMVGYFEDDEASDQVMLDDGWLSTGDMGYMLDGHVVITGRSKDLILHNGRNIWPQDIEWAVERVEPLRGGDVAAVAVEGADGDDEVLVLVQCRLNGDNEREKLRRQVAAVVHQNAGVECDVVLVPPKSLPFTSSGKLSRAAAKAKFISGEIQEIAPRIVPGRMDMAPVRVAQGGK
ncbi:MAG: fatty acyl-AMP ligase [Hyphomicrobiales bacterium]